MFSFLTHLITFIPKDKDASENDNSRQEGVKTHQDRTCRDHSNDFIRA